MEQHNSSPHVSHAIELFIEPELLPKRNFQFSLIFLFGGELRTAIHISHVVDVFIDIDLLPKRNFQFLVLFLFGREIDLA